MSNNHFIPFENSTAHYKLPEKFTFPFSYEPHPLTEMAAKELQEQLKLIYNGEEIGGKMYGVLVVLNRNNELGCLMAFSGQLEHYAHSIPFVPPVSNRLDKEGFFKKGEDALFEINRMVAVLEEDPEYLELINNLKEEQKKANAELKKQQELKHHAKMDRKNQREEAIIELTPFEMDELEQKLKKESVAQHYNYKKLSEIWKQRIAGLQSKVDVYKNKINSLKTERKNKSAKLQQALFDQYQFLNRKGEVKNLADIFDSVGAPPAGAGDCAVPKLLQYAYQNHMKPLAMAEFWWGKPPKSELRKEGRYYPACSGKCKPILAHMLQGLEVEDDPLLSYSADDKEIDIIYEDDHLVVINKPAGLLSIPAKEIKDSVLSRMQEKYPKATGPLLAHRLDKLTSGLLVLTKSLEDHTVIQNQFIDRSIKKRYIAILEGIIDQNEGVILLPLAVDEDNRPMQRVDYEKGRSAKTVFKVLERKNGQTLIQFTPITGRTHQLRVHAAHPEGLSTPIVGDKLYGARSERLMLHAEFVQFNHPQSGKKLKFQVDPEFHLMD